MLIAAFFLIFVSIFAIALAFIPMDIRPKLKLDIGHSRDPLGAQKDKADMSLAERLLSPLRKIANINQVLAGSLGKGYSKNLKVSQVKLSVEEFLLVKEVFVLFFMGLAWKYNPDPSLSATGLLISFGLGWILPDFWLKRKVGVVKDTIAKELPDTVDLLGLCVNSGLDFMMAIKYIIEKSPPSLVVEELKIMMQEISLGKTRRDALRDLAQKYDMKDLYTFSRTLIQADRMGTSVADALNILAEDMRLARFARGEAMALKAPMKMLVPLLFCIFPVVAILVAGPVFIDFFHNNPIQKLGH